MSANDDLLSIQILALKSREKPDFESEFRKILRWFSKEFSISIKEAETLDPHYILLHRFEDYIQNLEDKEYLAYKKKLLYPEVIEKEESEDDDWIKQEIEALKKAQEALNNKAKETPDKLNLSTGEFDVEFK